MTSWLALRKLVYERDRGRCQVCMQRVRRVWDAGHLVDRIAGGQDELDNLYLSCVHCNRVSKPITPTRAEALAWLESARTRARTGRDIDTDWRPAWRLMTGSHGVGQDRRPDS